MLQIGDAVTAEGYRDIVFSIYIFFTTNLVKKYLNIEKELVPRLFSKPSPDIVFGALQGISEDAMQMKESLEFVDKFHQKSGGMFRNTLSIATMNLSTDTNRAIDKFIDMFDAVYALSSGRATKKEYYKARDEFNNKLIFLNHTAQAVAQHP